MNERRMQFGVGVVVLATMILGGLLVSFNGPVSTSWMPWATGNYDVGIAVPQAPGVDKHTPVRKNGVLIGRVKSIEDKDQGVVIWAEVYAKPLYAEYIPRVRTTALGDATIEFSSRAPAPGSQPVPPKTVFQGEVVPNPFDSLASLGELKEDFAASSRALGQAGDEVAKLAKRVNDAFGDETSGNQGRVNRLLDTTERAMNQFADTMTSMNQTINSVNEIIGDGPVVRQTNMLQAPVNGQRVPPGPPSFNGQRAPNGQPINGQPLPAGQQPTEGQQLRGKLREGLNELPDAIHEFRATMRESQTVLKSAEKNFKNLEGFTEPLGQKGEDFAVAILKVADGLDKLVSDFNTLTQAINSRQGTVGKLIYDPQVYENFNRLMFNANQVLCDIQTAVNDVAFRLKPILTDARIFMSKVAEEPGRFVSGAISPSTVK
jgi:phospholipid/cholesterol/gamma-HCH transport system substrate-binding protein